MRDGHARWLLSGAFNGRPIGVTRVTNLKCILGGIHGLLDTWSHAGLSGSMRFQTSVAERLHGMFQKYVNYCGILILLKS